MNSRPWLKALKKSVAEMASEGPHRQPKETSTAPGRVLTKPTVLSNERISGCYGIHSGLSTDPKTEEERQRTVESSRVRTPNRRSGEKRGKRQAVTQQGGRQ